MIVFCHFLVSFWFQSKHGLSQNLRSKLPVFERVGKVKFLSAALSKYFQVIGPCTKK